MGLCLFSLHTVILKCKKNNSSEKTVIWRNKNSFSLCLSALNIIHLDYFKIQSLFQWHKIQIVFRLIHHVLKLSHTYKEPPTAASAHLPTIQSVLLSHDASHWHNREKIRFHPPQGLCSGADMENDFRELLRPIKLISGSLTNETLFLTMLKVQVFQSEFNTDIKITLTVFLL